MNVAKCSITIGMNQKFDLEWDAGELGCGEILIKLRSKMLELSSEQVLKLRALDNGAVEDIPAWCGMTKHLLLIAEHPFYYIKKKKE